MRRSAVGGGLVVGLLLACAHQGEPEVPLVSHQVEDQAVRLHGGPTWMAGEASAEAEPDETPPLDQAVEAEPPVPAAAEPPFR